MHYWLLLLFSLNAFSQENISIKGQLFAKGTKKPLTEVNIFILPHKLKAVTDSKGQFLIEAVPKGECSFIINLSGFEKYESQEECSQRDNLNIYLEKKSYTTFETTVVGKVNKRDGQTQSLTQDEFIKMPGSFGGDPVRAAQNLPGVAQTGASAQIIVQGASPEDTGYLIDGHRVPIVFHFGGLSSVIIPEAVERVDLLPSGYGPEYSRAIGGIIGLSTTVPKKDRLHGLAFIDLLNAGGLIEGPIDDKSSFLVSGRYSYIGQVLKAVADNNDNFDLTAAPTYYDFSAIYQRDLNEKNKFKTSFVASKDNLELILNRAAGNDPQLRGNFENRTEFFRFIPQLSTRINETTRMDNSLGFGKDSIFVNVNGRYLDVNSNIISHRSELVKEWKPTYKTYLGLDNQYSDFVAKINLPTSYSIGGVRTPFSVGEERKFDTKGQSLLLGAYLRQEIKTSEDSKWTYLPNLRVDHFTLNDDTVVQPRLQVRYQLDPSLTLRASVGDYVQIPQPQELTEYYGNKNLRSPRATHYTAGFTKDFRKDNSQGLEVLSNLFYKELKDLVIPDITKNYSNDGSGDIVGGEVQAKYRKNEWMSQLVYTYLDSTRNIPGFGTQPSEFDQTHNVNIIGSYNTQKWTFAGRFRFVTGNPYTPLLGSSYDSDNDVFIPNRGRIYSERFDSFKQLDIRIDRKFVYDTWILTAYLDVQNILNSPNPQSIQYSYDYSEKKKVRGLPVLPTFGVKGEF